MIAWMIAPAGLNIDTSFVIAVFTMLVIAQSLIPPITRSHSEPSDSTIICHAAIGPSITIALTKSKASSSIATRSSPIIFTSLTRIFW